MTQFLSPCLEKKKKRNREKENLHLPPELVPVFSAAMLHLEQNFPTNKDMDITKNTE